MYWFKNKKKADFSLLRGGGEPRKQLPFLLNNLEYCKIWTIETEFCSELNQVIFTSRGFI